DQRLRFRRLQSFDARAVVTYDVKRLASSARMRADDRVRHRWIAVDFRLGRRKGTLAPGKIEDGASSLDAAPERLRQRVPRCGGAGELGIAQRQPKQVSHLQRTQYRPARRARRVAHV